MTFEEFKPEIKLIGKMQDLRDLCDAVILGQEHSAGLPCDKPFQIFTQEIPVSARNRRVSALSDTEPLCQRPHMCRCTDRILRELKHLSD